jgi:hypothetical protein
VSPGTQVTAGPLHDRWDSDRFGPLATHPRGTVYFIEATGAVPETAPHTIVKIGYTADHDVTNRQRTLQTGSPLQLCLLHTLEGTKVSERAIQVRLIHLRVGGEWFRLPHEIRETAEQHDTAEEFFVDLLHHLAQEPNMAMGRAFAQAEHRFPGRGADAAVARQLRDQRITLTLPDWMNRR